MFSSEHVSPVQLSSNPEPSEAAASWVNPLKAQFLSDSFTCLCRLK